MKLHFNQNILIPAYRMLTYEYYVHHICQTIEVILVCHNDGEDRKLLWLSFRMQYRVENILNKNLNQITESYKSNKKQINFELLTSSTMKHLEPYLTFKSGHKPPRPD